MGAFFLSAPDAQVREQHVRRVFENKGFGQPAEFSLQGWQLLLYRKQVASTQNSVEADGRSVFAVGTVAYRGLSYGESLRALLTDHYARGIDQEKLIGNFGVPTHGPAS
jgi:hypothetical protein